MLSGDFGVMIKQCNFEIMSWIFSGFGKKIK